MAEAKQEMKIGPKVGHKMPDGTVYAGTSPDTNEDMYTPPADAPRTMKWKEAMEYTAKLAAHGYLDWRVPTKGELDILYNNRAAIAGFNETDSYPGGWYWSSSQEDGNFAWDQRFGDGGQSLINELNYSALRCVR